MKRLCALVLGACVVFAAPGSAPYAAAAAVTRGRAAGSIVRLNALRPLGIANPPSAIGTLPVAPGLSALPAPAVLPPAAAPAAASASVSAAAASPSADAAAPPAAEEGSSEDQAKEGAVRFDGAVSAGEVLREYAKTDPEVAAMMNRGELVPAELVVRLVAERLAKPDVAKSGFRAIPGAALNGAILLDVPKKELLRRVLARGRAETNYAKLRPMLDALLRRAAPLSRWKARLSAAAAKILPAGPSGERRLALLLFGWNFLTIATYYIITPVRGAFLLHNFGPTMLPWVYMTSAAVTGLAVWVYSRFAGLPRFKLIGGTLLFLALNLVGWWAIGLAASQIGWVSFAYYIWGDVFSIMAVTLFWTYANDRFGPEAAKRTFGFMAAGGPLGAIAGSLLTKTLVVATGVMPLLLAAAGVFGASLLFFGLAERTRYQKEVAAGPAQLAAKAEGPGILKTIASSKFLTFLAGLVLLERLVPDFGNYLFNAAAYAAYPQKADMVAFNASFGLWQNVLSLAASLFLTSVILKKLGIGKALLGAPLTNLVGLALFMVSPILPVVVGFSGLEGLQRYTWFKSAKEATYTVGSKDVIYKVKAFIEMFLYRFARGLAGLILLIITGGAFLGLGPAAVALAGIPLAALWVYVSWRLGREFTKQSGAVGDRRVA